MRAHTLLLLVCASPLAATAAAPAPYQADIRVVRLHLRYEVNADATFTMDEEQLFEVLTQRGAHNATTDELSYSDSLQAIDVLEAYTLKKDGKRLDVGKDQMQDRAVIAGGGPMFSDIKAKSLIFPSVEVGDRVGLRARMTQRQPMFPGEFSFTSSFPRSVPYDDAEIVVSAPASLDLRTFASGVAGGEPVERDGRRIWTWTFHNGDLEEPEGGVADYLQTVPRVLVSTFKDFGEIARAYDARAQPESQPTPEIRKLADEITKGIRGERERATALEAWVARNVRYAGNCIGIGSVVPHAAEEVLHNRLGDCKDHTALLQALLTSKGIASTPVLINSGAQYALPDLPEPGYFNHVITYVPSLGAYADSTADFVPFGTVPFSEAGKPVLHTAHFEGVNHTPPLHAEELYSRTKRMLTLHGDGSADGEIHSEDAPILSIPLRHAMENLKPDGEDDVVRNLLKNAGWTGTGSLIKADPRAPGPMKYGFKFHADDAINLPGPGSLGTGSPMPPALPIAVWAQAASEKPRKTNYGCAGGMSVDDAVFELPPKVKVLSLPHDVSLRSGPLSYDASYRQDGNKVTLHRELHESGDTRVCTPADLEGSRDTARAILKDLSSPILYQSAE